MRILLIGNYQLDAIQSMDIFASMLENYLTQLGHQVRIIRPNPWFGKLLSSVFWRKWLGYIDKFVIFPAQLRQALSWADVVHICDQGNAVYVKYLGNVPHVITCHDLFPIRSGLGEFPECRTGWTGKQFQQMVMRGLNQGQKVACVSQQTQSDVLRLSSLPQSAVSVIPMGLNYAYSPMTATEFKPRLQALGIPEDCQFILHVGANHWYKNRLGVLSIFNQLILQQPEFYLVMVGKPMTDEMHQFIKTYNITKKVIELVEIDNENLRAIYSSTTALLFPSLYEGFGWPIIEAQACGCPVFTSNRSPMNDVGGEAAIYIEPDQPKETAEAIIRHLPLLKTLKSKGFVNSQKYSAEIMISEYIKLYHQAINQKYERQVKM
jgi:glycosyltransferase involved in cell wall biosynthesis